DHLEGEVGLDAGAHVEIAGIEQRPAAMLTLDAPEIDRDLRLESGVDGLAEIVPQQDIFGGNGRVRLELEDPMTVLSLNGEEGARRPLDGAIEQAGRRLGRIGKSDRGVWHWLSRTATDVTWRALLRDCRSGSRLRWLPAGRSRSNHPRGRDCSTASADPAAWR